MAKVFILGIFFRRARKASHTSWLECVRTRQKSLQVFLRLLHYLHSTILLAEPISTPTDTPLLLSSSTSHKVELVVFVGYPCLGKSSFYRRHFQPIGYTHVNQDILKKREKCVQAVKESLRAGLSCVVGKPPACSLSKPTHLNTDNTNRDFKTRKFYVDVARGLDVPIRCVPLILCLTDVNSIGSSSQMLHF